MNPFKTIEKPFRSSFFQDFKKFIMRGNVVDMAVGVIVGTAFGNVVSSLVNDLIMPPLGLLVGSIDFSEQVITLRPAHDAVKAVTINYGAFINHVIHFLIVGFSIYLVIKGMNTLWKQESPPQAPAEKRCPECSMNIPSAARKCPHCTSPVPAQI